MTSRIAPVLSILAVASCVLLVGCPKPTEVNKAPGTPVETKSPAADNAAGNETGAAGNAVSAPETADAKALFETKCNKCHKATRAAKNPGDAAHWDELVKEMAGKKKGWISEAEAAQIAEYLAQQYPK